MIAKVVRGYRPAGLLAYLFGPGRHEEHRNPRVVASWDGAPWLHQPDKLHAVVLDGEVVEPGEFDLDLRQLIQTMHAPLKQARLPANGPPAITPQWAAHLQSGMPLSGGAPQWLRHYAYDSRKQAVVMRPGPVWHCSVRLHPDDPTLTDEQWQHIADRLMRATGIQQAGCRWIAVRHADDHIHLVATLVSEHTGRRFHPYRDYPKLRAACQQLERELGLVPTPGIDRTAAPAPTRAEHGKAQRLGRARTAREELRRLVAQSAAASDSGEQFLAALRQDGLNPAVSHDATGQVRGYTVALPGDLTAAGQQVRYPGSQLAPDLTWPKLSTRWTSTPTRAVPATASRRDALRDTAVSVDTASAAVRDGREDVEGIAHAAGEILSVLGRAQDGRDAGALTEIADRYARAARAPHHVVPADISMVARELRWAARRLAAVGALSGRGQERLATATLVLALASLVAEIAAWQQARGRPSQAAAAHATAHALPKLTVPATRARVATATLQPTVQRPSRPLYGAQAPRYHRRQ